MGRFVLIAAAIAAAAAASCYRPDLIDCADTCSASHLCPDGLSCTNGYCRTAGATGACTLPVVDAGHMCPMAPQGHGTPVSCGTAMPQMPNAPGCFVVCTPAASGTSATGYMFNTWVAGAIGSAGDEVAAKALIGGPAWFGLTAPAGSGANAANWRWSSGEPMPYTDWAAGEPMDSGAGGNCAMLTSSGWVTEPCSMAHPFLIHTPPI